MRRARKAAAAARAAVPCARTTGNAATDGIATPGCPPEEPRPDNAHARPCIRVLAPAAVTGTVATYDGDAPGYTMTDTLLGAGRSGRVYRARRCANTRAEYAVAVKRVPVPECCSTDALAMAMQAVVRQVTLCRRVQGCPFVIVMHEPWFDRRARVLALPMEAGDCSLADYAKACDYTYEPLVLLSVCVQCARALEAVHRCGLVHRDVRPSHFVVNRIAPKRLPPSAWPPRVCLTNFSMACALDDDAPPPLLPATDGARAFAPPEVLANDPAAALSTARDVWSLGATFFVIATGAMPRSVPCPPPRCSHSPPRNSPSFVHEPYFDVHGRLLGREAHAVLQVAARMLATDFRQRPSASAVLDALDYLLAVGAPPGLGDGPVNADETHAASAASASASAAATCADTVARSGLTSPSTLSEATMLPPRREPPKLVRLDFLRSKSPA